MTFKCPKCEAEYFDRLKYCPECGFDFTAAQKRCPKCRSQIHVDDKICPECGLDFEQYSYFIPRLVVFSSLAVVLLIVFITPWIWKTSPGLHDTALISDGYLRSDLQGQALVPLFMHWKSGENYVQKSRDQGGLDYTTDYMMKLVPLPPGVIFHFDIPIGERVWIIRWKKGRSFGGGDGGTGVAGERWAQVGRWKSGADKYGWVHESNLMVEE